MKLIIPNEEALPATVRESFDGFRKQITESYQQAHDSQGNRKRFVLVAYHGTTQQLTNNTWTAVEFNGEEDLRGVAGIEPPIGVHSKTMRTDRFKVPEGYAGRIRIRAAVGFAANATGSRGLRIDKNGATQRGSFVFVAAATAVGATQLQCAWNGTVAVGDDLQLFAYQNSGGNLNIGGTATEAMNEIEVEFL